MKLLTTICIPALLLGAAALTTPAMAQADAPSSASGNAAAATPAQPAQDANSAAVPALAGSQTSTDTSANAQAPASGNTQLAMNTPGNAGDLSSVPDNQHKYNRAKKVSQDRSEDQTTKDLNQKESSLNGASSTQ
jgi:hypothetical protein